MMYFLVKDGLYICGFNKIYKREFNESEENLFYLYILLKESIRSELIQANEKVGFINFPGVSE